MNETSVRDSKGRISFILLGYFALQIILTITLFMYWVTNNGFGGGFDGMTPLAFMLIIPLQFILGLLGFLFMYWFRIASSVVTLLFFLFCFEVAFYFVFGYFSIVRIFDEGFNGSLHRAYSLSSIFSFLLTIVVMVVVEKLIALRRKR